MTALGKTLVFFVLLFSVMTGGMMAMAFATRTNWKYGYDNAVAELKVAADAQKAERQFFEEKRKALEDKNAVLAKALEDQNAVLLGVKANLVAEQKKNDELNKKANVADQNNKSATTQIDALSRERDQMKAQITERNNLILQVQADLSKLRDSETQATILAGRLKDERENLMVQVERQNAQLRELAQRGIQPQNNPKPPPVEVSGKISGVDGSIAQTTLGKDHGVNVGDELQVYRLNPSPTYLGKLRITISREHDSVGTFTPAGRNISIKKDDTVDTKVLRGSAN